MEVKLKEKRDAIIRRQAAEEQSRKAKNIYVNTREKQDHEEWKQADNAYKQAVADRVFMEMDYKRMIMKQREAEREKEEKKKEEERKKIEDDKKKMQAFLELSMYRKRAEETLKKAEEERKKADEEQKKAKEEANQRTSLKCLQCGGPHPISKCARFTGMSIQNRWADVRQNNRCRNCLMPASTNHNCLASYCRRCGPGIKHNSLLCGKNPQNI